MSSFPSFTVEKKLQYSRAPKTHSFPTMKNPVVRSKSYNVPMLTPVVEYDIDSSSGGSTGIRRHSVCEMSSCMEESSSMNKCAARMTDDTSVSNSSTASTTSAALTGKPNRSCLFFLYCASQSHPFNLPTLCHVKSTNSNVLDWDIMLYTNAKSFCIAKEKLRFPFFLFFLYEQEI